MSVREQIEAWAADVRAEREAICAEQPDVSPERARLVAECEERATVDRAVGLPPTCECGAHPWGGEA